MGINWFRKKESQNNYVDFSEVDSQEKALQLFTDEKLHKLYLMPLEFGGQDHVGNILYVPGFVVELKARFDATIENLLIDGKQLNYKVIPSYNGSSFIPSELTIVVNGDVDFSETIQIW